jgi:hypothetical protein
METAAGTEAPTAKRTRTANATRTRSGKGACLLERQSDYFGAAADGLNNFCPFT